MIVQYNLWSVVRLLLLYFWSYKDPLQESKAYKERSSDGQNIPLVCALLVSFAPTNFNTVNLKFKPFQLKSLK